MALLKRMPKKSASAVLTACILAFGSANFANAQSLLYPGIQKSAVKLGKRDKGITEFYAERKYKPIWVGSQNASRRNAFIKILKEASAHGLPETRYNPKALQAAFRSARGADQRGAAEMLATKTFVQYARDITSGVVTPSAIDPEIAIKPRRISSKSVLTNFSKSSPKAYLQKLAPRNAEYKKLMEERKRLLKKMRGSEVADVPVATLRPGKSSKNVKMMRAKLQALGYGRLGDSPTYDAELVKVVKKFQADRGLGADGVAGPATIKAMNFGPKSQMTKVLVNLERQRWMNFNRGDRHVSVNLADYSVSVVDKGRISFKSRTVIGQRKDDFRTPEFIDEMTHLVVNPTWNVPKSIAVKEYVPIIMKDKSFLRKRNMVMVSSNGKAVNPSNADLAQYDKTNFKTFPYFIKQRPDPKNALGRVKFMFPNKYNIYLHDTPSKSLFNKELRTFSHGCVRVHKPFDFAYKLLEKQLNNPKGTFKTWLDTGKEKYVNLKTSVPVYITYRTAFFDGGDKAVYRSDVYGRDAKVYNALKRAGVTLGSS